MIFISRFSAPRVEVWRSALFADMVNKETCTCTLLIPVFLLGVKWDGGKKKKHFLIKIMNYNFGFIKKDYYLFLSIWEVEDYGPYSWTHDQQSNHFNHLGNH